MAVATAVVAAWIALLATGEWAAWWAVLASLPVFAGAYLVLFLMNLGGWNRRWKSKWRPDPSVARLNLRLLPKDRTVKHGGPVVDCWVRTPGGNTFKHRPYSGRSYRGEYDALYPEQFDGPPALTTGRYRVTWLEEAKSGKWREILTHRLTVTDAMLHRPGP